ncbi:glutathione synthetase, variant 3 [Aphanomyces astaci]|uniref:glutathione synthase n=1 Tax=Aphanomyces astaci TaxID=112090 RepID=W4FHA6_APHAT|nr:glutathione synthetase, variant 3 [Aphanomyces astaci]ETV66902.1 glutathione synthetase, variant 3 [Aphanomyces astaci]|eukprot:XP_009843542.1 glutathione synthetase, variant 3 [Aphanomyces astaci]
MPLDMACWCKPQSSAMRTCRTASSPCPFRANNLNWESSCPLFLRCSSIVWPPTRTGYTSSFRMSWRKTPLLAVSSSCPRPCRRKGTKPSLSAHRHECCGSVVQTAALGIHRSDYMLHDDPSNATSPQILQVELNTIAASFACMSSLASDLHRFLLERYEAQIPSAYYGNVGDLATHLPRNPALHALPAALARAHSHYGRPSAVIVFVVQPNESNSVDQRWLEYTLWTAHKVKVFRRSLHQLATAEVRGATRELWVDGVEVAVAYFRAGYTPTDYPSETEWIGRTLVERSLAIKCPNIAYHLAGTKKVQQVLATPSELRRFLTEDQSVLVEKSFTGLFGLEQASPDLPRIKALVAANPTGYVLKPQREGGGNNLYGEEVVEALATLTPAELESFILMERILPQEQPAVLVRNGAPVSGDTISELGMFSVALFDNGKAILNEHAGHLLRTKLSTTNEGGVAAGFAVLSSPFLV